MPAAFAMSSSTIADIDDPPNPLLRAGNASNNASNSERLTISEPSPITSFTAASIISWRSKPSMTANPGSSPSSSAWARSIREHMPWMVDIHAESTLSAGSNRPFARSVDRTRLLISDAALSVKVMASTWSMSSIPEFDSGERA